MSKRYFKNPFSDSPANALNTSFEYWKNRVYNLTECIGKNASTSSDNDLYTGTAGIAYMYYRLAISDGFKNDYNMFMNKAIEVSKLKVSNFGQNSISQFICGDAGVNAVNAAIYHQMGDEKMAEMYLNNFRNGITICKPIDFFRPGGDELFVGRAGYLYGVLWLEKVFNKKIISDEDVIELCSTIVESGRKYSRRHKSIFPLMYSYYNTEYLGKIINLYIFTWIKCMFLFCFRSCTWVMHNITSINFISSIY